MKNRLLLFANDAASANVTIAYTYFYGKYFDTIIAYSEGVATKLYEQHISKYMDSSKITFNHQDTVVTGTSGLNSSYEMGIIKKAKIAKVYHTLSIVDNTSNFEMRFTLDKRISTNNIPDEIWVFKKNFLSNNNLLNSKIKYKENIYIEFLKQFYLTNPILPVHSLVSKYNGQYLVILTEYLYELYGLKYGFTEYEMLENILEQISLMKLNIPIFLKTHPREHKNKFNIILRKYSHLNIFQIECNIQELICFSKIVLGINSSVFIECVIFNKPHFSIQINSTKNILLSFSDDKNIIYTQKKLKEILIEYGIS